MFCLGTTSTAAQAEERRSQWHWSVMESHVSMSPTPLPYLNQAPVQAGVLLAVPALKAMQHAALILHAAHKQGSV